MAYDYPVVSLDSDNSVYADVEMADTYLNAAFHADNWNNSLDEEAKGRALVTAVRTLDRQIWLGEKTDPTQALDWPRKDTGVVGVTDNVIPIDIVNASIELALSISQGSNVQNVQSGDSNIQSLGAGSARISYFRGGGNGGSPTRFPQIVWELVRPYMIAAGDVTLAATQSTGTDRETVTGRDFGFAQGL